MKRKFAVSAVGVAGVVMALVLWPVRPAGAGALDFLHDQLGVTTTNLVFGAPPSEIANLRRYNQTANTEYWTLDTPESAISVFSGGHKHVQYTFVSNQLEAVEVWNGGKEKNDQLLATFKGMLKQPRKPAPGIANYLYEDGTYQLSYRGLCNPSENWVAIFRLSTEAGERRIQQATAAQAGGPAVFQVQHANFLMSGERPVAASVLFQRNSGPASNVTFKAAAGMKVEVQHPTGGPGLDNYYLFFRPDRGTPFMPATWRFSLLYTDVNGQPQHRSYEAVPSKEAKTPPTLDVTEARE